MEIGVAQPLRGDAIHGGSGYDAAEGARCAEALIIRHNEQHVGRALRRHDARRPPRLRLRGLLLDHPAECGIRRRKLFAVDRGGGFGRTRDTCDLLSQCRDTTEGEKTCGRKHAATDFHGGKLPLRYRAAFIKLASIRIWLPLIIPTLVARRIGIDDEPRFEAARDLGGHRTVALVDATCRHDIVPSSC